jgi:hypothetical protein
VRKIYEFLTYPLSSHSPHDSQTAYYPYWRKAVLEDADPRKPHVLAISASCRYGRDRKEDEKGGAGPIRGAIRFPRRTALVSHMELDQTDPLVLSVDPHSSHHMITLRTRTAPSPRPQGVSSVLYSRTATPRDNDSRSKFEKPPTCTGGLSP